MLTDTGDYKSTTYYQQIAAALPNPTDQLSFALRLVIHYIGDIHQPLHSEAEVNTPMKLVMRAVTPNKFPRLLVSKTCTASGILSSTSTQATP